MRKYVSRIYSHISAIGRTPGQVAWCSTDWVAWWWVGWPDWLLGFGGFGGQRWVAWYSPTENASSTVSPLFAINPHCVR